jgi:hypothetical protein
MDFLEWRGALAVELAKQFGMSHAEAVKYIADTGDACWREMYNDELTPAEAAAEEISASVE